VLLSRAVDRLSRQRARVANIVEIWERVPDSIHHGAI